MLTRDLFELANLLVKDDEIYVQNRTSKNFYVRKMPKM